MEGAQASAQLIRDRHGLRPCGDLQQGAVNVQEKGDP
jgi:hypothetical protein